MIRKIFLLILIVLSVTVFFFSRRFILYFVSTSSMEPAIPKSTIILVDKKSNFDLGDVITYELKKDSLVTHRIVEVNHTENSKYFITKGDANVEEDKIPVSLEAVKGRVIFTFPYLGYVFICLIHPIFLLFYFYIPIGHHFGISTKRFVNQIRT